MPFPRALSALVLPPRLSLTPSCNILAPTPHLGHGPSRLAPMLASHSTYCLSPPHVVRTVLWQSSGLYLSSMPSSPSWHPLPLMLRQAGSSPASFASTRTICCFTSGRSRPSLGPNLLPHPGPPVALLPPTSVPVSEFSELKVELLALQTEFEAFK